MVGTLHTLMHQHQYNNFLQQKAMGEAKLEGYYVSGGVYRIYGCKFLLFGSRALSNNVLWVLIIICGSMP